MDTNIKLLILFFGLCGIFIFFYIIYLISIKCKIYINNRNNRNNTNNININNNNINNIDDDIDDNIITNIIIHHNQIHQNPIPPEYKEFDEVSLPPSYSD